MARMMGRKTRAPAWARVSLYNQSFPETARMIKRFFSAFVCAGILLLTALPVDSAAQQPYGLSPALDLPLAAGILSMKYHSGSLLAETRARPIDYGNLSPGDLPAFDRWAVGLHSPRLSGFSSVLAGMELLVPLSVNAWDTYTGRQAWHGALVDALLLQEALMISSSLSSYSKSIPMHSTPLTYDPRVPESEKRLPQNASSFFSNHTTTAFTTAVFSAYTFQLRHPDSPLRPWVWGGTLAMATGVGSLRVLAGKHFPSDVVAGAAVGSLVGYLVPKLHTRAAARAAEARGRDGKPPKLDVDFALAPIGGSYLPGAVVNVAF
jgi:hypothetical protein